ncbi:unnamed protein product [Phytophthora lilii]|uniref:Unnamed protein product n=1 Tax=Phytophthora lilii TaxID=2077276 RepID=A0A9W6TL08_9STRA|nr:unnamed protein product [Phytophthora lilii]
MEKHPDTLCGSILHYVPVDDEDAEMLYVNGKALLDPYPEGIEQVPKARWNNMFNALPTHMTPRLPRTVPTKFGDAENIYSECLIDMGSTPLPQLFTGNLLRRRLHYWGVQSGLLGSLQHCETRALFVGTAPHFAEICSQQAPVTTVLFCRDHGQARADRRRLGRHRARRGAQGGALGGQVDAVLAQVSSGPGGVHPGGEPESRGGIRASGRVSIARGAPVHAQAQGHSVRLDRRDGRHSVAQRTHGDQGGARCQDEHALLRAVSAVNGIKANLARLTAILMFGTVSCWCTTCWRA